MEEEFNLSKKKKVSIFSNMFIYPEEDVREFIKRLKASIDPKVLNEQFDISMDEWSTVGMQIDRLAGEDLK